MSDLSSNPLLASVGHISKSASIALAVIDGILAIAMIAKLVVIKENRFAYIMLTVLVSIRVATFALRGVVSTKSPDEADYKGVVTAASVLLIAGFLFLLEAIGSLLIQWITLIRNITVSRRNSFRLHCLLHFIFLSITIIGIIGSIILTGAISNPNTSSSTYDTAKVLREISGILFIVIIVIFLFTLLFITTISSRSLHKHTRAISYIPGVCVLGTLMVCAVLEAVYRLWSAIAHTGFIVTEGAVGVLVFMPEFVILLIVLLVNLDDMGDIKMAWQSRRAEHIEMSVSRESA